MPIPFYKSRRCEGGGPDVDGNFSKREHLDAPWNLELSLHSSGNIAFIMVSPTVSKNRFTSCYS